MRSTMALSGTSIPTHTVIAGLGGRPITRKTLRPLFATAMAGELPEVHFLDLREDVIEREIWRASEGSHTGPHAESILRNIGIVRAEPV